MEKMAKMPEHQLTIPNSLILDENLSWHEKVVLSEIIWLQNLNSRKNNQEYCHASNFYLKSFMQFKSERAITDIISNLAKKGYIRILVNAHGSFRRVKYDFDKCFERDIALGLIKRK